jgi:glutaredoxin 3
VLSAAAWRYEGGMKDVTIYTTDSCPYCRRAEAFLHERGVPFKQIDVTGDDAARVKLVELSGGRRTVPQIFIGELAVGGYTDLIALHQKGELDPLLQG